MDTQDTRTHFDLVVIGGGPGGYGAALYATSAGLDVAIVEMNVMGGTCLNRGCIPAKAFLETAAVQRHVAHAADFGIESSAPTVNFGTAQARKQKIVDGIVKSLIGFMKSKKITILDGTGSLGPGRTVTVAHPDGYVVHAHRRRRRPRRRLGAAHHPRLRSGRADHDERRGADARPRARADDRHRWRGHRLRVRQHVRRRRLAR